MLKNKEYLSMADVINHDQNLKKLEDKIESTLKNQGVPLNKKTISNIQRMTILVGNYCLDSTSDINCLVEALSKIEQGELLRLIEVRASCFYHHCVQAYLRMNACLT